MRIPINFSCLAQSVLILSITLAVCVDGWCHEILPAPAPIEAEYPPAPPTRPAFGDVQVQLDIKMIEIDVAKLRQLGFDVASIGNATSTGDSHDEKVTGAMRLAEGGPFDAKLLNGIMESLCQNDLATVLAEPTLVTLSGRAAKFATERKVTRDRIGTGKEQAVGTRVDILPRISEGNRLKIELRLEWCGVSPGDKSKDLRTHMLDTAFAVNSGQTFVVATSTELTKSDGSDQKTVLVMVTPRTLLTVMESNAVRPPSTKRY